MVKKRASKYETLEIVHSYRQDRASSADNVPVAVATRKGVVTLSLSVVPIAQDARPRTRQ